jgi:hypothetical protein
MLRTYTRLLAPDVNMGGESSNSPADAANEHQEDVKQETESSTVEKDVKKEPTLQDVVKGVLDKHAKPDTSSEEKKEDSSILKSNETSEKKEETKVEKKDETKVEKVVEKVDDAKLPFGKHPRFVELVGQKNAAESKVREFEPIVQRMQNVEKFCQANKIEPSDYKEALEIAAMVKTNPQEAVKKLSQYVEALKQQTGESLPADLQKKVDDGLIHIDDAKEVAKLRLQVNGQRSQQERQQLEQQQRTQQELTTSLNSWGATKTLSDPDFKPKVSADAPDGKYELVFNKFLYYWNTQPVQTVAQAVALLDKAYSDISGSLKSFLPPPPRKRPLTTNGSSTKQHEETIDVSKPGWARKVAAGLSTR